MPMKIKISQIKDLVKECVVEILREEGQPEPTSNPHSRYAQQSGANGFGDKDFAVNEAEQSHFSTLSDTLTAIEEFIIKDRIQVDTQMHPANDADPYGIRQPFMYGGISYEDKRDAHYKLLTYKGRPTKKYLHVSIYRMSSGSYELTRYVS